GAVGAVLEANAELADVLGRLDERPPDIVIADNAEFVGDAGLLRVSDGRGYAGIGNRDNHINGSGSLARKFRPAGFAYVIDAAAANDRVRPREIDVLEDTGPRRHRRERLVRMRAFLVEN